MNDLDLIPFRTLLDHVVVPARRHARATLMAVAVPLALAGVAMSLAQVRWAGTMTTADPEDLGGFFLGFFAVMALALVTMVVYVLAFTALTAAAMDAISGRPVRMVRAWAYAFRPSVILTLLLVGFLDLLAFMMCFVPALFVVPLLSFTLPAMIDEKRTGLDAVNRSIELVRFNPTGRFTHSPWLQVFVLLLVGTIISYAINFTVQAPFAIAQQVLLMRETVSGEDVFGVLRTVYWLQLPASVLGAVATALAGLYSTFGICLLFREVRRRKEAQDLTKAVDRLTSAEPATAGQG